MGMRLLKALQGKATRILPQYSFLIAVFLLVTASPSQGTPIWTKLTEYVSPPYDEPGFGRVRRFEVQIRNDSTEGEALVEYRLPVGSAQGATA